MILKPVPLDARAFSPFGDVIEADPSRRSTMNDGRFQRFDELAKTDVESGCAQIGIVRCDTATPLPYEFDLVERHPLGSQAFIPLAEFSFVVVVARGDTPVDPGALNAFFTNGRQGINYHRGTWHMPLIASIPGQEFLVIDRSGPGANCDQQRLPTTVTLVAPA